MAGDDTSKRGETARGGQKLTPLPPMTDAERACDIGDLLEVTAGFVVHDWDGNPTQVTASGQIYRAEDLKGRGWDLVLVSGDGPEELRFMNGDVPKFFKVLPGKPSSHS